MKSLLLASALFASASLLPAQQVGAGQAGAVSAADTLITLSEEELAQAVQRVAAARLAAEQRFVAQPSLLQQSPSSGLNAETLRLVKLQLLLQALGLTPGLAPTVAPQGFAPQQAAPQYLPYALPQSAPAQTYDPRVDRLEQLMMLLVQQRQAERDAFVLPGTSGRTAQAAARTATQPQQRAAQHTSDSLLRVIQSELVSLRASQPQAPAQPQVIIQQAPALQPQTLAPEVRTEYRTDTIVRSLGFKRQVFFAVGQSKLLPEARLTLNEVYRYLAEDPKLQLFLTGHASPEGNARANERLSQARSQAVLDYLIACGISADRLQVVAGGVDHQTELAGVARRVDIELRK